MKLSIFLLGRPRVERDGQLLAITRRKSLGILCYLARNRRAYSREVLASLLWPNQDTASSLANLRRLLSRLRAEIGPECFCTDRRQVQINPLLLEGDDQGNRLWVDLFEFEGLIEKAGGLSCTGKASSDADRIALLEAAAALCAGDFMAGFNLPDNSEFDDWHFLEMQGIHHRQTQLFETLALLHAAQGNHETAIDHARRWLALDMPNEAIHRLLMQLYADSGDLAAASRQYAECVRVLEQDYEDQPAEETQALYHRIRKRRPSGGTRLPEYAPATSDAPPNNVGNGRFTAYDDLPVAEIPPGPSNIPLVGRENNLQSLVNAWAQAGVRGAMLARINGEPGIGKSRLAETFAAWARAHGVVTVSARAFASEGGMSFGPIRDWLNDGQFSAVLRQLDDVWVQELSRLLPRLLEGRNLAPLPPLTGGSQRQRFFEALSVAIMAHRKPLLLVLDDLQWCDDDTLSWLHFQLRAAATRDRNDGAFLLIATMRTGETPTGKTLSTLLAELQRDAALQDIALEPLSEDDAAKLALSVADKPLATGTLSELFRRSSGNPLFVIESIRSGFGTDIAHDAGTDGFPGLLPATNQRSRVIPEKIQTLIAARIQQLSAEQQEIVGLAAVAGRSFGFDLFSDITQQDEDTLAHCLDELVARNILVESAARYDFSHDLLRDIAYQRIGTARRRIWHRRVAEAIQRQHAANLDAVNAAIAAHLSQAGEYRKAVDFYQRAALAAGDLGAYREATAHLYRALALLEQFDRDPWRVETEFELQLRLSVLLRLTHGWASSEIWQALSRARALSQTLKRTDHLRNILFGLSTFHFVRGDVPNTLDTAEQLRRLGQSVDSQRILLAADFLTGLALFLKGELEVSRSRLEQALARRPITGEDGSEPFATNCEVHALVTLAHVMWLLGHTGRARECASESRRIAADDDKPSSAIIAAGYSAVLHQLEREADAIRAQCEATVQASARHQFSYYEHWCALLNQWAAGVCDKDAVDLDDMLRGIEHFKATDSRARLPYFLSLVVEIQLLQNDLGGAQQQLAEAFASSEAHQDHWWDAELHRLNAELLLRQGADKQAVRASCRRAIEVAQQQNARALELRAMLDLTRLQPEDHELRAQLARLCESLAAGGENRDVSAARILLSGGD
jgi:DNA-binding SARP family transcriptional activator